MTATIARSQVTIRHFTATYSQRRGDYEIVKVHTPRGTVEVSVSPAGRSVQVFMDGKPMEVAA